MRISTDTSIKQALRKEKRTLLRRVGLWLETPMIILGFVWMALLILELTRGLNPVLEALGTAIWIIFIVEFIFRLALAEQKWKHIKRNWLTAIALLVPAVRVFRFGHLIRVLRLGHATRGMRLFRVLSSLNRGMSALGKTMGRRGFGYAAALTFIVIFAGAAGMHAFESNNPDGRGLHDYPSALWWTAMMITTVGSEYWPQTVEGRILCLGLALYAFAVFGYLAATLSSFFIERDAAHDQAELVGTHSVNELRKQVADVQADLRTLLDRSERQGTGEGK